MSICNLLSVALLLFVFIDYVATTDTLKSPQFINDSESLISPDNTFKLGFFSPVNSTNRYVAIWYNQIPVITPIWIANRDKPLNDSSGTFKLSENGNLLVFNGQNQILWSSNVSTGTASLNSTAQLNNDGNLILSDSINGNIKWESFQQPLNILARHMRLTVDARTGEKAVLTSWKSNSDPSIGSFSLEINPSPIPQAYIRNGTSLYWRSGPWNGQIFIGIPFMNPVYLDGFTLVPADKNGVLTFSFNYVNESTLYNYVLSSEGQFSQRNWIDETKSWEVIDWFTPQTQCDVYGTCGLFGVCNPQDSPICGCLRGFEPKNADEWGRGNWSGGCARRRSLQCGMMNNGSELEEKDGFLKVEMVKVPDFAHWSTSPELECEEDCLNNCSCVAYSYYNGFGCLTWSEDLIDTQEFSRGGADLHFRVSYLELDKKRSKIKMKVIISMTALAGSFSILICACFLWRIAKLKARKRKRMKILFAKKRNQSTISDVNRLIDNQVKLQELPVFDLQMLTTATDNFDIANKLGQGGFGPVYKGKLPDAQDIAVKRLSRASGQGLEEFVNEVVLISKLQHRNLVRLFGCCVDGEEKMLVYEYMPNKSLDAFLFDPNRKQLLDWRKRFHIVEGICRGLLYLHRDSRLRIIHRDLKPSNILLDHELNPKISDFGMARIFGGNDDQGDTKRVVGTYGYMSPEYAMEGRFSEKSDVFSLGVLLLEITSGRRNTSFYESDEGLSLLGYAWKLWNENRIEDIVDEVLSESDPIICKSEIFRCIHVGLLCVQEFARDRPNSSTVLSMLTSEIVDLPTPRQPAFSASQIRLESDNQKTHSVNMVTVTGVDGR